MKKFKTIVIFLLAGGLAFFAWYLGGSKGNSQLSDEALSDFAVNDTASIDKLILTDTEGSAGIELIRTAEGWTDKDGDCIQQHLVDLILKTIKHVKVKSLVPKETIETVNKNLTAHHKKMDIYLKGELIKTWYIGSATPDHYGTYMLLKDPEKGKSPEPFIMHMPNEHGSLTSRFITNPLEFECTGVFNYDPLDIKMIDLQIPDSMHLSFKIIANNENNFSLFNNGKPVDEFDTSKVRTYILFYKKAHFESHNTLLSPKQVDSLKAEVPFYTIEVQAKSGTSNKVLFYRKRFLEPRVGYDGEPLIYDQDRVWVVLNDGRLVVGQYHTFNKHMRTIRFFGVQPGPPLN